MIKYSRCNGLPEKQWPGTDGYSNLLVRRHGKQEILAVGFEEGLKIKGLGVSEEL